MITGTALTIISCGGKRERGRAYMPDMADSRAYETYDYRDTSLFTTKDSGNGEKIFYNNMPVHGTMARGEQAPFPLTKDVNGDTANYVASKAIPNPLPALNQAEMVEAERLYLVNCGICHGTKLDGNGPLYNGGNGKYSAAPKNLVTLNMPDGQMFYSVTYGKNAMGSYASQLNRQQRWMVIHYIKAQQAKAAGGGATGKPTATADSAAMAKK